MNKEAAGLMAALLVGGLLSSCAAPQDVVEPNGTTRPTTAVRTAEADGAFFGAIYRALSSEGDAEAIKDRDDLAMASAIETCSALAGDPTPSELLSAVEEFVPTPERQFIGGVISGAAVAAYCPDELMVGLQGPAGAFLYTLSRFLGHYSPADSEVYQQMAAIECEALAAGKTPEALLAERLSNGGHPYEEGVFVGAALASVCPASPS